MASQTQKRSASEQLNLLENVKAVVLDIEGTTTPLSFVHDKLFGYVRDNVKAYLSERWDNEEVQADVDALRQQASSDKEAAVEGVIEIAAKEEEQEKCIQSVVDSILWQMDNDRKSASLKQLQGHMWRDAYKTGKVQGEVYDDVVEALKAFKAAERNVYLYSSASVDSQKLLFGYSEKGDLTEFLAGNFDASIGAKTEKDSYSAIAGEIGVSPSEILFVTDLPREASPAAEAGVNVAIIVRDGNTALTEEETDEYTVINSLAEVSTSDDEPPAKKAAPEVVAEESNGAGGEEDEDDLDDDELGEVDDDEVVDDDDAAADEGN